MENGVLTKSFIADSGSDFGNAVAESGDWLAFGKIGFGCDLKMGRERSLLSV